VSQRRPDGTCIRSPATHTRHICVIKLYYTNKHDKAARLLLLCFCASALPYVCLGDARGAAGAGPGSQGSYRPLQNSCDLVLLPEVLLSLPGERERLGERERGSPARHRGLDPVAPLSPASQRFNVSSTVNEGYVASPCAVPSCRHVHND